MKKTKLVIVFALLLVLALPVISVNAEPNVEAPKMLTEEELKALNKIKEENEKGGNNVKEEKGNEVEAPKMLTEEELKALNKIKEENEKGGNNVKEEKGNEVEAPKMLTEEELKVLNKIKEENEKGGNNVKEEKKAKKVSSASERALERRSKVANTVQELLAVADRNGGIGEQVRVIAQEQNQEKIEDALAIAKNRGSLKKFFFGPDYKALNDIADKLAMYDKKLQQLKDLAGQMENKEDASMLSEKIAVLEEVKKELGVEAQNEEKSFSLFGWMVKMMAK